MAIGVFHSLSALVSRMTRKLLGTGGPRGIDAAKIAPSWAPYLSRRISLIPFRSGGGNKKDLVGKEKSMRRGREEEESDDVEKSSTEEGEDREEEGLEDDEAVWRRMILLGEKCQPLDFSGAIYYDGDGRRLPQLPPRSPLRSPLPSFSLPVDISAEKGRNY